MTTKRASAPGKLILIGEYAVLRDAPAVVMAVDRRAIVRITPHTHPWHSLSTPGLADGERRFELREDASPVWLDGEPEPGLPIVEAVFSQAGYGALPPASIEIDTRAFAEPESGIKFGLGSSAAATVALVAALAASDVDIAEIWRRARRAHDAAQGGSGADVAASCFGGLLAYKRSDDAAPQRLTWPDGLDYRVLFSGRPASTSDAIDRSAAAGIPPECWQELESSAAAALEDWQGGDATSAIDAIRQYRDALRRFDEAGIRTIFSAGHDELVRLGDETGVVYKPSGAGGGDCGIALSVDGDRLDEFSRAARSRGFVPLDVRRDNRGV